MTELTDLELRKKIAEIEGVDFSYGQHKKDPAYLWVSSERKIYNPLTNKALLFDLMVKHKVEIIHCVNKVSSDHLMTSFDYKCDGDIPRAILECIIEAQGK